MYNAWFLNGDVYFLPYSAIENGEIFTWLVLFYFFFGGRGCNAPTATSLAEVQVAEDPDWHFYLIFMYMIYQVEIYPG